MRAILVSHPSRWALKKPLDIQRFDKYLARYTT
jgi:hypothetical protein